MRENQTSDSPISFRWLPRNATSIEDIAKWLKLFGDLLPNPLSQRVDVREYGKKLNKLGEIGLASVGAETVGLIALYANDLTSRRCHITILTLLPEHRGRGIGRVMLSRAFALARARGMRVAWLTVDVDNTRACSAYSAVGMRVVRTVPPKHEMEIVLEDAQLNAKDSCTQIESAPHLASVFGLDIDLRIKRDDLYPLAGGGIKARKIQRIWPDIISGSHDVIVTTGGPQSNHARATAIMAARAGIICHLVISLDEKKEYLDTGNILLMRMCGAIIDYCCLGKISEHMDRAMSLYRSRGHNPLYIWGGGHCLSGTVAFVEAAQEAQEQCGDWTPDYLIHASGTGSTQAGLAIGYRNTRTEVIGISVARDEKRGSDVIHACIDEYCNAFGGKSQDIQVSFRDEWTAGGYERRSDELMAVCETACKAGLIVDPTYSGKGLHGLVDMVRSGRIRPGSRVLFWHTGGLMNLMASEYAGRIVRL